VTIRVLLVDDRIEFLAAARRLLEREGVEVVATATTIAEAVRQAPETSPDVALVDIDLGGESGFELARRLVEQDGAGPPVILISTHEEADFADLIAESSAIAFLPKSELSADAIRRILDGEPPVP
jgi:DNA-binding NarL/FixJ family response regulator